MSSNKFIINLDRVEEQLGKIANPQIVQSAIEKTCLKIEADAVDLCPVDTGNLRGSITTEIGELEGAVGTNVEYAEFVEFGTSKMPAQPFLYPAFAKNKNDVIENIKKNMEREVK